jgi:hypothetical protein
MSFKHSVGIGFFSVITLFLLIAGCTYKPPVTNENLTSIPGEIQVTSPTGTPVASGTPAASASPTATPTASPTPSDAQLNVKELPILKVREGDVVSFPNLKAEDPDGKPITFTYSSPLGADGKWQTKIGDAGQYKVRITASDGKSQVSQDVLVNVEPRNQPPIIADMPELTFNEGDKIVLRPQVTDAENDKVTLTYSGWMNSDTYQTTFNDAGNHEVTVTASDGKAATQRKIVVHVLHVNRAPSLKKIDDVVIKEGQKITVKPQAVDEDGNIITYLFSKPLDETGSWKTKKGDAGKYKVTVTASDGLLNTTQGFTITVESLNLPPVIEMESTVTVRENDLITLNPRVTDPDNNPVTVTYSGWMTTNTKQTGFSDQGNHTVTITANNGKTSAEKNITIVVIDVNRPPEFVRII